MSDVKVSKEIDYTVTQTVTPKYNYAKITPNTTNTSIVIGAASTQDLRFELPTKAFNLAKSYITYDLTFAAGAADSWHVVNLDTPPLFSGITLMPRMSQTPLVNITNYLPQMMKTLLPREMKKEDYLIRDSSQFFYPSNEFVSTPIVGLPSTNLAAATVAAHAVGVYTSVSGSAAAVTVDTGVPTVSTTGNVTSALAGNITSCGYPATINMLENKHIAMAPLAAQAFAMTNKRVQLSDLKGTLFEVDRDLIFPDVLTMTLTLGYANRHVYWLNNVTVPNQNTTTAYVNYTGDTTINNLCLYLAVETEPSIVNQLNSVLENKMGYELAMPVTQINQQAYGSGTAQNISLTINNIGRGARLKRIYHTLFQNQNGQSSAQTALDCSNSMRFSPSDKIVNYYTMLNSDRLQSYNVDCTKNEDWNINQPYLKEKSIFGNVQHYKYFWSHLDDFTEGHDVENGMTGMPMTMNSYKWDLQANMEVGLAAATATQPTTAVATASGQNVVHFTFVIVNRLLNISKSGVVVL